jgi:hypothetical protein
VAGSCEYGDELAGSGDTELERSKGCKDARRTFLCWFSCAHSHYYAVVKVYM